MPSTDNASTTLSNWDFHTYHVESQLKGGEFVSAESTLIASGPPDITSLLNVNGKDGIEIDNAAVREVYPMGVMENASLSQSKQLQRIFEIGSSRSYFVPGRVVGALSYGRVFYNGVSMLRAHYSYYRSSGRVKVDPADLNINFAPSPNPSRNAPDLRVNPGYGNFWQNLASDVFNQPTGNFWYFRDMANRDVSSLYFEYMYCQGTQLQISSGSVLLMEGASFQYDRIVPAKMSFTRQ